MIIFRRVFFIMGLLYVYRAFTFRYININVTHTGFVLLPNGLAGKGALQFTPLLEKKEQLLKKCKEKLRMTTHVLFAYN
jgi:predicted YcjX-like family ATPase